jgi:hypothetical protein
VKRGEEQARAALQGQDPVFHSQGGDGGGIGGTNIGFVINFVLVRAKLK